MTEPKPFASLSSGLLARKGAAKPAMRPQGFGQIGAAGLEDLGWNDMGYAPPAPADDDHDPLPKHVPSSIAALTPAPRLDASGRPVEAEEEWDEEEDEEEAAAPPPVIEQQRAIAASFAAPEPESEPEPERVEFEATPVDTAEPEEVEQACPAQDAFEEPQPVRVKVQALPATPAEPAIAEPARAIGKAKAAFTLRLDADRHLKLRLACAVTHRSAQQIVSDALDDFLLSLPELDAMARQMPARG